MEQKEYYVYMLRCADDTIYTGITTDFARRLKEHRSGEKTNSGYTKSHGAKGFDALWETRGRGNASKLEALLKRLTRRQKEQLISEPNFLKALTDADDSIYEYKGRYYG